MVSRRRMLDALSWFGHSVVTNVFASVIIIVVVTAASVGSGLYAMFKVQPSPVIDLSIKAFGIPNHIVSQRQDAFDLAVQDYVTYIKTGRIQRRSLKHTIADSHSEPIASDLPGMSVDNYQRKKRSTDGGATQYKKWAVVYLVFLAKNGDNVFTLDRIATAGKIEREVVQLQHFSDFCYMEQNQCVPLKSLIPYIYSESVTDSQDVLDGAVRQALSLPYGIYFTDGHVNETYHKSQFLRSEIYFGCPLAGEYIFTLLKLPVCV
jgi:hypothetical protein